MSHGVRGSLAALVVLLGTVAPAFCASLTHGRVRPGQGIHCDGTLTRVDWTNPHIYWYVTLKTMPPETSIRGPLKDRLRACCIAPGITREVFKIGQVVTVTAFPGKRRHEAFGFGKKTKYADGHEMYFNKL